MLEQYSQEEFWKLYEKLPQELKDAIFSGDTADHIVNICKRYDIAEGNIPNIVKQIRNVLLGLLSPNDFQGVLELELKIEKEVSEKIFHEVNRFIFYPVKAELEQLYGVKTGDGDAFTERAEQKQNRTAGEDRYREVVE